MIKFYDLNLLSWNIQRVASVEARWHLKELIQKFKSSIICLYEMHVLIKKVKKFWNMLVYEVLAVCL